MSNFKDVLATLPSIDNIAKLELFDGAKPEAVWTIENKPGKQGSLRVYYKVTTDFGGMTPKAAQKAIELFCEHVQDARDNPGKHPNIDFLFGVIDENKHLAAKASLQ
ncbi:MAG: DUF2322 family protein [Gammaproteobacteria bacterium]|nr:DUF2322 family protein [Gammaproteobacteria bacterium]